jgi:redox-sensitive bicupin YhaK (pirin superfamily)
VTYVLEGALRHQDSTGGGSTIQRGEVQRMSAGSGIAHSEFNASREAPVHLLQIWIFPDKTNVTPGYEQKAFPDTEKRGRLRLVASPDGRGGSLTLNQDAFLYATLLGDGEAVTYSLPAGRRAYLHAARGALAANGEVLESGDGARIEEVTEIRLEGRGEAEALLFDLP